MEPEQSSTPLLIQPKQARSRQTVRSILEAAAELFATRGYEHVSTSDIATLAGKPVGSIYTYFKDKQQILLAVWDMIYREEAEAALAALDLRSSADLHTVISTSVSRLFERHLLYRRLSPTLAYLATQNAEVAERVRELNRTALERLHQFLRDVNQRGMGNIPDPEATAVVIQVATETLAGMGLPYTSHVSRDRIRSVLTQMILSYIASGTR